MFEFIPNLYHDLHAITVHFPIAFLTLSFFLSLFARRGETFSRMSWMLLVIGSLVAIAAVITGLISHEPYEALPVMETIEPHERLGLLGTLVLLVLTGVRLRARRKGTDIDSHPAYLAFAAIGLLWLLLLGGTGGNLVYQHGVNVRGVNPLLELEAK
jgi:uncharacterized membrane protein